MTRDEYRILKTQLKLDGYKDFELWGCVEEGPHSEEDADFLVMYNDGELPHCFRRPCKSRADLYLHSGGWRIERWL
jgi:hypothetical protein